jgi:outer membrane scaffolding protein for murein synthesis (MipA/OmpV family)
MADEQEKLALPLPPARCLSKTQAAEYLGIGVTLLAEIGPKPIKLGRRCVYDVIDLDTWLDEYKARGRARKEVLWPENKDSTNARTRRTGGSTWSSRTDAEYVKALGYDDCKTRKST